jgi:hypothetical protein
MPRGVIIFAAVLIYFLRLQYMHHLFNESLFCPSVFTPLSRTQAQIIFKLRLEL